MYTMYVQENTEGKRNAHTALYSLIYEINAEESNKPVLVTAEHEEDGIDDAQLFSPLLTEFEVESENRDVLDD